MLKVPPVWQPGGCSPGLFDENRPIVQSQRLMKKLCFVLAIGALTSQLYAQTNAPAPVRQVSLQDCIELALRNNLELQISRYNPQLSLFDLQGSYGSY